MSVRHNPRIVASVDTKRRGRGNVIGFREILCSSRGDPGNPFFSGPRAPLSPNSGACETTGRRRELSLRTRVSLSERAKRVATTYITDAQQPGTVASPYMEDTRGNRGSYSAVRSGGPEGCSLGASCFPSQPEATENQPTAAYFSLGHCISTFPVLPKVVVPDAQPGAHRRKPSPATTSTIAVTAVVASSRKLLVILRARI